MPGARATLSPRSKSGVVCVFVALIQSTGSNCKSWQVRYEGALACPPSTNNRKEWNRFLADSGLSLNAGRRNLVYLGGTTSKSFNSVLGQHIAFAAGYAVGASAYASHEKDGRPRRPQLPLPAVSEDYVTALHDFYAALGGFTALGAPIAQPRKLRKTTPAPRPNDTAWDCDICRVHTKREDFAIKEIKRGRTVLRPYCRACDAAIKRQQRNRKNGGAK